MNWQSATRTRYVYNRCNVKRIVDADTLDIAVDLGFHMQFTDRFRLFGVDAFEVRGSEREKGLRAKQAVIEVVAVNQGRCRIETLKDERGKYGRWLAVVYLSTIGSLNSWLITTGHAHS